jgi:hypothetical protein
MQHQNVIPAVVVEDVAVVVVAAAVFPETAIQIAPASCKQPRLPIVHTPC